MKNYIKLVAALLYLSSSISFAGWLGGPDNYDECVLEKMKGQEKYMIPTARNACWQKFPDIKINKQIACSKISCGNLDEKKCYEFRSLSSEISQEQYGNKYTCFDNISFHQWEKYNNN